MPTIPSAASEPAAPSPRPGRPAGESHQQRQMAESFGVDPQGYDRARPRYPAALVDRIIAASPGPAILVAGCGTGIDARQFQAAGGQVLGVEPDERMASFARRTGIDTEVATFEAWDPRGRTFDVVAAGQAWHWVDPVAGAAQAARILRPGGRLAAYWNAFVPGPDLGAAFARIYDRVLPDAPFNAWSAPVMAGYSRLLGRAADGIRASGAFGEPEEWRYDWTRVYTTAEWLDQLPTHGDKTQLPPAQLAAVLAAFADFIDGLGGSFTMGYTTVAVTATRTGAS